jgi:3-dehydroquinate dehydratase/shikimate dehydrogenase
MSDICVASHHSSIAELLADKEFLGLANREGFLVELRLDFYSDLSIENLDRALKVFAPRTVVTCRHPDEGGKNPKLSDAERLAFLQHAADVGVEYVDVEKRTPHENFNARGVRLVESFHDFVTGPASDKFDERLAEFPYTRGAIEKVACLPKSNEDQQGLIELCSLANVIRALGNTSIVIGMGEAGLWTRILAPLFNAPFSFARGEGAPGTAPGQPTWRELDELYRFRQMKPGWPVYGVIGNPIGHSLSPLLHNTALRELDLPGVYVPFKVEDDPVEFVRAFTAIGLRGVSITIPHKEAAWEKIAELDSLAKNIGALNTLTCRDGKWFATNTDASAAADALESAAGSLAGMKVVILGAGGAAKAVAFGVKERGAEIFLLNRTRERAEALATACGGRVITHAELPNAKIDAIVNTTPIGMHPNVDASPLEKDQIPQGSIVFDTVYNPLRTKLLNLAAERGCKTVEGWTMFLGQGIRQFELWTGKKAPREAMEKAVLNALTQRQAKQK